MEPVIATEYTGAARRQEVLPPRREGRQRKKHRALGENTRWRRQFYAAGGL